MPNYTEPSIVVLRHSVQTGWGITFAVDGHSLITEIYYCAR